MDRIGAAKCRENQLGGLMSKSSLVAACSVALAVSACTSIEPLRPDLAARSVPSRLDEIAYINSLRDAFDYSEVDKANCYDGADLKYFRPELEQGYPDHTRGQEALPQDKCVKFKTLTEANRGPAVTKYLEAGFGLTDLYCQRFFVIAAQSDRKRQFERNSGSTVDALMNAVLGLSGAGQTALGLSNAAFEAYDSTYQNIQDAFLVSPDIANVRKLVQAAQLDFKTRTLKAMPTSYEDGRSTIERYAGICSYTGMKQLVNDSVTSQTQELTNSANPPSSAPKDATNNGGGKSGGKPGQASQQPQTPPPPSPTAQVPLANASKE